MNQTMSPLVCQTARVWVSWDFDWATEIDRLYSEIGEEVGWDRKMLQLGQGQQALPGLLTQQADTGK